MSKIEWTGETWNPIAGCSIVSPGCTNCYAMRTAARLQSMDYSQRAKTPADAHDTLPLRHYRGLTTYTKGGPVWSGKVALAPDNIFLEPLRRQKPVTYFVNSMSDLFNDDVPDEWIDRVFAVMAMAPQHTFQVLTKRAVRMRRYFDDAGEVSRQWFVAAEAARMVEDGDTTLDVIGTGTWPLPNVWLGVSTERQAEADERIPLLLDTPAAVRFISAEPLLGPVDLVFPVYHDGTDSSHRGYLRDESEPDDFRFHAPKLDWVIVGGESGAGARPMHPDWALALRDQCAAAGVPFFFKQWGEWAPISDIPEDVSDAAYDPPPANDPEAIRRCRVETCAMNSDGRRMSLDMPNAMSGPSPMMMMRLGRKKTKRRLRGTIHGAMPRQREIATCK